MFKIKTTPKKLDSRLNDGTELGNTLYNLKDKNNKMKSESISKPNLQIDPNLTAISNNLSTTKCTNEVV